MLRSKGISIKTKIRMFNSNVIPVFNSNVIPVFNSNV